VLNGAEAATITQAYGEIVRSKIPGYRRGMVASVGREHVHYRRVAFPLARDGEHVDMLMFVFMYDDKPSTSNASGILPQRARSIQKR
jgi:hypothetical protein